MSDKLSCNKKKKLWKSSSKKSNWTIPSLIPGLVCDMCLPISLLNKPQKILSFLFASESF